MSRSELAKLAEKLRRRGFDGSYVRKDAEGGDTVRVRCSQCQASAINGVAVHEFGCPNEKRRDDVDNDI